MLIGLVAAAVFSTPAQAQLIQTQMIEVDCGVANVEDVIAKQQPALPRAMVKKLVQDLCPNGTGPSAVPPPPKHVAWQSEDCFPKEQIAIRARQRPNVPSQFVTPALIADITEACGKLAPPVPVDPARSHVGPVEVAQFLPGGRFAISGGADNTLRLWNVHSDDPPRLVYTAPDKILRLSVSPDGRQAVIGGFNLRPTVVDIESGRVVATLDGTQKFMSNAVFLPDGAMMLASASDTELGIFFAATGKLMRKFAPFVGSIDVIAVSSDVRVAAAGSSDDLRVFLVETGQNALVGQQPSISTLVFEPGNGNRLVIGAREKFDIYNMATGKIGPTLAFRPKTGHRGVGAVFLPQKDRLLTCSRDLQEWDLASGRLVRDIMSFPFQCTALSLSTDSRTVLVAHDDSDIRLVDVESGRLIRSLGQPKPVTRTLQIPLR